MIDLEKIKQYIKEERKYNSKVKIVNFSEKNLRFSESIDYLHVEFENGIIEVIILEKYLEWIQKKRSECIKEILN